MPQDGDAYAGLGRAEFTLGDFRSSQQAFRSALRGNPADVEDGRSSSNWLS